MNSTINIFNEVEDNVPNTEQLQQWLQLVLTQQQKTGVVNLTLITSDEIQALNQQFRGKDTPTNVLSFPFEADELTRNESLIGDIVICAEVVNQEAQDQEKTPAAHWAHMCIHGCLHLLGYDHMAEKDAKVMEPLEIDYLQELGFSNPYE